MLNEMSAIPNGECNKIIDHSDKILVNKCEVCIVVLKIRNEKYKFISSELHLGKFKSFGFE